MLDDENKPAGNEGNQPEPKPAAKTPDPKPEAPKDDAKATALQKQLDETNALLEKYKQKEQKRLDAEKTASELLPERDKEIAQLKRDRMVDRIRREGGYTAKVFDAVNPQGEDEAAIKAEFESHKSGLDEYINEKSPKPGQGGGTQTPQGSSSEKKDGKPESTLVRLGIVKPKATV